MWLAIGIVNTWRGVSGDLRSGALRLGGGFGRGDVGGPFEEFSFVEHRAGADQGDQVRGVDRPPTGLCGVDQLVGHGNTGRPGPRPLVTFVLKRTVAKVDSIVILSSRMSVFDVRHEASGSLVLLAGRGYLQPSRKQSLRRKSACYTGGFAGLVA